MGETALLRQPGDAPVAAAFLVAGRRDLDRPGRVGPEREEGLDRHDRRGEAALHVAGAAAIDPPRLQFAAEGVPGPAEPRLHHVDMAVEMHARPRPRPFAPRRQVPAGMPVAVPRRAFRPQQRAVEPLGPEPRRQKLAGVAIVLAGGVHRGDADQRLGQRHQVPLPRPQGRVQRLDPIRHPLHLRAPSFAPRRPRVQRARERRPQEIAAACARLRRIPSCFATPSRARGSGSASASEDSRLSIAPARAAPVPWPPIGSGAGC